MKHKIGVAGVGKMGFPIIANLNSAGFAVAAYARRREAVDKLKTTGINVVGSPKELAESSDIIIDILTDTTATWSMLKQEDGLLDGFNSPKIFLDMTTSDPEESMKLGAFLREKKVEYLDCPITGGTIGAESRNLVVMVGGSHDVFNECRYIFDAIAKKVFYLGQMGKGHYMKLVHNQLSHSTFLAACEAVVLGKALGLNPGQMVEVFNCGNARSYATEVKLPRFVLSETFKAGASFSTVHKDLDLVNKQAVKINYTLPIAQAAYQYWQYPMAKGLENDDYSTIINLIEQMQKDNQ